MLIGFTDSIQSNFWVVLMLPVVSAATAFGVVGSLIFTTLASGAYLSFLLFLDWNAVTIESPEVLYLRVLCLYMVGNLANILDEALREQSEQHRRAALQLAEANRQVLEAEEAVRRSDRLAALGQLTAGLAHELRNPLGTIKASAEMLEKTLASENEVAREMAGFISTEVDRTNSLVTRFLQFARPLQVRLERADLAQTLDRSIADATRELVMQDVATKPDLAGVEQRLKADLAALEQRLTAAMDTLALRLTVRMGVMLAEGLSLVVALIGLLIRSH